MRHLLRLSPLNEKNKLFFKILFILKFRREPYDIKSFFFKSGVCHSGTCASVCRQVIVCLALKGGHLWISHRAEPH